MSSDIRHRNPALTVQEVIDAQPFKILLEELNEIRTAAIDGGPEALNDFIELILSYKDDPTLFDKAKYIVETLILPSIQCAALSEWYLNTLLNESERSEELFKIINMRYLDFSEEALEFYFSRWPELVVTNSTPSPVLGLAMQSQHRKIALYAKNGFSLEIEIQSITYFLMYDSFCKEIEFRPKDNWIGKNLSEAMPFLPER